MSGAAADKADQRQPRGDARRQREIGVASAAADEAELRQGIGGGVGARH